MDNLGHEKDCRCYICKAERLRAQLDVAEKRIDALMDALADNVHPKDCTADEEGGNCNHCRAFALMDHIDSERPKESQCSGPHTDARDCPVHAPSKKVSE